MMYTCEYCQETRGKASDPCRGCGSRKHQESKLQMNDRWEFYYKGFFVKVIHEVAKAANTYYIFRGDQLIDSMTINCLQIEDLRHARGVKDGEQYFHLIWELFEDTWSGKGIAVRHFNDPEPKVLTVRIQRYEDWLNMQPKVACEPPKMMVSGAYADPRLLLSIAEGDIHVDFHGPKKTDEPIPKELESIFEHIAFGPQNWK